MTTAPHTRPLPCPPVAAIRPGLLDRLKLHLAVWRSRRQLARLDARALEDIGLTRSEAEEESRRAFWSAPDHWLR
ncbi:DUF1127 domain-containing protein [Cribrihabitans neustonicus]|uniref:DUF1127 domain-containing protein n=1 Tax=Cribrihabitans neustonicus TaxID=1429085 RepID=UPI003B5C87E5